jgi:Fe-S-cluster containining protein
VALLAHTEDRERWRRDGRRDILAIVDAETCQTDGMGDTALSGPCPFLTRHGAHFACAIYATRPRVCRDFRPGDPPCAQAEGFGPRHEFGGGGAATAADRPAKTAQHSEVGP